MVQNEEIANLKKHLDSVQEEEKARTAKMMAKHAEAQRQLTNLESARSGYHAWLYLRNLRGHDVRIEGLTPQQIIDTISTAFNSLKPTQTKEGLNRLVMAIKPESIREKMGPWLEQILDQVHLYSNPNVSINNLQRAFENLMDLNLTALTIEPSEEAKKRGEVAKNVPYREIVTVLGAIEKVMEHYKLKRTAEHKAEYKQHIEELVRKLPLGFDVLVYAEAMQAYWPNPTDVPKTGLLTESSEFRTRYITFITNRAKASSA